MHELFKDQLRDDLFDWAAARATLQAAVRGLPTPGCVALYGAWGAGKTTALRHLQADLDKTRIVSVWFNPWEYERTEDVLTPLLRAIMKQLPPGPDWGGLAKALLATFGKLSLGVAAGLLRLELPDVLKKAEELKPEELTAELAHWFKSDDEIQKTKKNFAKLVKQGLEVAKADRLIVFLDDLDRCLPDTTVQIIEAVKLLLCGDTDASAVFVFGLDRRIVGEAIAARYSSSNSYTGESYLEKIFDVSLEVPTVTKANVNSLVASLNLDELTSEGQKLEWLLEVLSQPVFANPRVVLRTLNRLRLFSLAHAARVPARRPNGAEDWKRLYVWVAGSERFRTFRLIYFQLTAGELAALHENIYPVDKGQSPLASETLAALVRAPGFVNYYQQLFGSSASAQQVALDRGLASETDALTIGEIDLLLRCHGL